MPKLDRYLLARIRPVHVRRAGGAADGQPGRRVRRPARRHRPRPVPAGLLLSQLGLRLIDFLPLILLPLALMLGLLLAIGRLYRDSEMPVLASIGRRARAPAAAAAAGRAAGGGGGGAVLAVAGAVGRARLARR